MRNFFFTSALLILPLQHLDGNHLNYTETVEVKIKPTKEESSSNSTKVDRPYEPFTGKITRNKVRMRLQPSLEAPILSEFSRDDLLNVVGEANEFYVILPPADTHAYIFRTFVLDNIVEGNRVNVRLEPALEAPVIAQLNTGDRVDGIISPLSSKWLEITPPASTRFYVCKEYVENIGSPSMMAEIQKRRTEVTTLLSSAHLISEAELKKDYQNIHLNKAISHLNTVIKEYTDFPQCVERAKELLANIQEIYLEKKISHLEARAIKAETAQSAITAKLISSIPPQIQPKIEETPANEIVEPVKTVMNSLDDHSEVGGNDLKIPNWNDPFNVNAMTAKMATWVPIEQSLYDTWSAKNGSGSPQDFYENQFGDAFTLRGVIEPYSRTVKNKPGDYLLISSSTALPIAYLYSTRVNLHDSVGHEVTLHGIKRPNNNFAFSAYFIISVE